MKTAFYDSENEEVYIEFNGRLTTAIIRDRNGVTARGHALHSSPDDYSESFGQALALSRATSRYFKKVEKKLVRGTK